MKDDRGSTTTERNRADKSGVTADSHAPCGSAWSLGSCALCLARRMRWIKQLQLHDDIRIIRRIRFKRDVGSLVNEFVIGIWVNRRYAEKRWSVCLRRLARC